VKINRKGTPKELFALLLAFFWLIFISVIHSFFSSPRHTRQKLRVGFLPITCHLLLPIALARDISLKKVVEPIKYLSWPDMIESIKGQELDAALILAPIALSLIAQGVPVEIALLGHREGTGLVVSTSSNIKYPADFIGKTVAIPIRFSTQNLSFLKFLKENNIDSNNVNIVELPPPDMPFALAAHSIDAYIVGEPYATQAEVIKKGKIYLRSKDIWPNFISSILIISKKALENKKYLVDKFIRSLYKQASWVESHRKKAANITASFFGIDEELIKKVLLNKEVHYKKLLPKKEEFDYIDELMVNFGLISKQVSYSFYNGWK